MHLTTYNVMVWHISADQFVPCPVVFHCSSMRWPLVCTNSLWHWSLWEVSSPSHLSPPPHPPMTSPWLIRKQNPCMVSISGQNWQNNIGLYETDINFTNLYFHQNICFPHIFVCFSFLWFLMKSSHCCSTLEDFFCFFVAIMFVRVSVKVLIFSQSFWLHEILSTASIYTCNKGVSVLFQSVFYNILR